MKTHKLLLYEFASKRMRNKLLLLWLVLLALALFDLLITPVLGSLWFVLWLAILLLMLVWVYYAFLMRRAAFIVTPNYLLLQVPFKSVKISYGRVSSITSSHMAQHYNLKQLKGQDRFLVKPLYEYVCGFIELNSLPKALRKERRLWFSPYLFSPRLSGMLLVVDNWMQLSRDVEVARQHWREKRGLAQKEDKRSLAARILDY
ncbi:MAG: hypothetical protein GY796_19940 [Chloroflexi bacterium]|nr:hypothetical protein [Chloroflexota bacterium]